MMSGPLACAWTGGPAFGLLNRIAEPLIRSGFGSPGLWPCGAVVLETTGRRTGRRIDVPVLATLVTDLAVAATVRPRSQWIANLAAQPRVHYWLAGRRRPATALVVTPGTAALRGDDSRPGAALARALEPWSRLWGWSFAVLAPGHPEGA